MTANYTPLWPLIKSNILLAVEQPLLAVNFEFERLDLQKELHLSLFLFLILTVLQHTITTYS